MSLTEFLEARIAEDEKIVTPHTVIVSGGCPAPEVPNCIGPDGRGCSNGWKLTPPKDATHHWWKAEEVQALIKAHEATHTTAAQRRTLAECTAKRAIINLANETLRAQADLRDASALGAELMHDDVLCALAAIYASHPDYRQEWVPE